MRMKCTLTLCCDSRPGAFAGDHTIATYVDYAGDIDASNDEIETTVTSLETPTVDLGSNGTYCDELTLQAIRALTMCEYRRYYPGDRDH